ncbi:hypothetical protein [Bacillus cytotoxicus]|uniref:hypothetical protein n=1 Tax=Bacillus cytotoxicus TaxID=580165 RepID=UPI00244A8450|nr:hypothetical protein [Bacillus cytotoxicus]MDH2880298.1 hypothetical protein [Bacillus cytotoxicus]
MNILTAIPRIYISNLQPHLDFYKSLLKQEQPHEFQVNETKVVRFSNVLLIVDENHIATRHIAATLVTDTIQFAKQFIVKHGGDILTEPIAVPTGIKMIARHPDGNIFEYIEPK